MKRVVVIDDSEIILDLVKDALASDDVEVTVMARPEDFAGIKSCKPDVILLDINMPEVFGDDVATFFVEEWQVETPIYFFSDLDEQSLAQRAAEAGVDGYICKGWGMERVLECISSILDER